LVRTGGLKFLSALNADFDAGAYSNISADERNWYGEGQAAIIGLEPNLWNLKEGFHSVISLGSQLQFTDGISPMRDKRLFWVALTACFGA
jgi:hypothetical protein